MAKGAAVRATALPRRPAVPFHAVPQRDLLIFTKQPHCQYSVVLINDSKRL